MNSLVPVGDDPKENKKDLIVLIDNLELIVVSTVCKRVFFEAKRRIEIKNLKDVLLDLLQMDIQIEDIHIIESFKGGIKFFPFQMRREKGLTSVLSVDI